MPAGPAAAPRGLPARLAGLGRLPHGEVPLVALAGLALAGGLPQVVQLLVGELQVAGEGPDVEVDVAVGLVGVAALDEAAHHLDHLGDVAGGTGLVGGRQAAQRVVAVVERALVLVTDRPPGAALLGGLLDDLVVDVGDVPDERHVVAAVGEPAAHDVEVQSGTDVPDVRCGLDGSATEVDRDTARCERDEVTDLPGAGVVQANSHASRVVGAVRCHGHAGSRRRPPVRVARGPGTAVRRASTPGSGLRVRRTRASDTRGLGFGPRARPAGSADPGLRPPSRLTRTPGAPRSDAGAGRRCRVPRTARRGWRAPGRQVRGA
ncbi:hypothetical protein SMICM17S_00216 [Streptomyces microflavus]